MQNELDTQQPTDAERATARSPRDAERRLTTLSALLERLDEAPQHAAAGGDELSHENRLAQVRLGIAGALFAAIRAKHPPTARHGLRTALGCSAWAALAQLPGQLRDEIEVAALLHDVGKIGVPDDILLKPRALNQAELPLMNQHHRIGLEILQACCASQAILDMVRYYGAWFDGSNPDFDRAGEQLPLGARMLAIVDAFDSMTTDHVYRRALSWERAIGELFQLAGTQFDPQLVEQFHKLQTADRKKLDAAIAKRWLHGLAATEVNAIWQASSAGPVPTPTPAPQPFDHPFFDILLDNMHDGVVFVDASRRIVQWNRGAERLTGVMAGAVSRKNWSPRLIDMQSLTGQVVDDGDCPVDEALMTGIQVLRRLRIVGRNEKTLTVDVHVVPVRGDDRMIRGATLLLHDASSVSTLEQYVEVLYEKATLDGLTKVANRREFETTLAEMVQLHADRARPLGLIICDLDHFKKVNDTHGHQAGDEALVVFADVLRRCCRKEDLVARYGGEEFVVVCPDGDNASTTELAERIRGDLAGTPIDALQGSNLTASFGVTELQAGDTPETLVARADRALLQAKDWGRNTVVQLGAGMDSAEEVEKTHWWSWLRRAPADHLLRRRLVTSVPLNVAAEKLRGFIADHKANIISMRENSMTMRIDAQNTPLRRRASDRPVTLLVELHFTALAPKVEHGVNRRAGPIQTEVQVVIRPRRQRDRRLRDSVKRSKHLLVSLKSYLMAHELTPGDYQPPPQQKTFDETDVPAPPVATETAETTESTG